MLNWTEEKGTEVIAHMIAAAKLIAYFMFSARDILDALHPGCARQALVAVILGYIQDFSAVVGYELLQAAGVVRDVQVGFVVEFDCVFHDVVCLCVIDDTNISHSDIFVKYFVKYFSKKNAQPQLAGHNTHNHNPMKLYVTHLVALLVILLQPATFRYGTGSFRAYRQS